MLYRRLKIAIVISSIAFLLIVGNIFSFSILQKTSELNRDPEERAQTKKTKESNAFSPPISQPKPAPIIKTPPPQPAPRPSYKAPVQPPYQQPIYIAPLPRMRTGAS